MKQQIHYALCFYHGACVIRDSIEYCLPNRNFSLDNYYAKKNALENILREDSYLTAFIQPNGEKGQQIKKNLQDLYDLVYNSNYIRVEDGKIIVDKTQNVKCIKQVVGLKQTFSEICLLHLNHCKEQNLCEVDQKYFDLLDKESEFFGCVGTLTIAHNVFLDRFVDFNKAMHESKGQGSVETNFISSEINDLINNASFIRNKTEGKGPHIKNVVEAFSEGVDLMSGKVKMEISDTKKLEDNFLPVLQKIQNEVNATEPDMKKMHTEVMNELIAFENELRAQNKN